MCLLTITGATEEEARKKATKATIEFSADPGNPGVMVYNVTHGNPPIDYRLLVTFGQPLQSIRSGKPVQVYRLNLSHNAQFVLLVLA